MKYSLILFFVAFNFVTLFSQVSNNQMIIDRMAQKEMVDWNLKQNYDSTMGDSSSKNAAIAKESVFARGVNDKIKVHLFGNGGLRASALGENASENPAIGSLGISVEYGKNSLFLIGYTLNNLKTLSINSKNIGANVLIPDLSGRSFTLLFNHFFSNVFGISGEILVGTSIWEIDAVEYNAAPSSIKVGCLITPFTNLLKDRENFISPVFFLGYSNRFLMGDITNNIDVVENNFGFSQTFFNAIEVGASLIINKTTLFANVPIILDNKDKINGLTGNQVIIGVTIQGDIYKF